MTGNEPWVLLPGMNCSDRLWSLVAPTGCLTPQLEETSVEAEVTRLLAELPDRFVLVGLSLGGIVAMALVARAPERVARLCLLSTNPSGPTPEQRAGWASLRDQLAAGRSARDIQTDLLPVLHSAGFLAGAGPGPNAHVGVEFSPGGRAAETVTLQMADDVGEARLDRQLQLQATRVDLRPTLGRISCPTLVIAARQDALCSVSRHEELQRVIPGSELAVVEQCGHLSPLERPQSIAALWAAWRSVDR